MFMVGLCSREFEVGSSWVAVSSSVGGVCVGVT